MLRTPGSLTLKPSLQNGHPVNLECVMADCCQHLNEQRDRDRDHHTSPWPTNIFTGDNDFSQNNKTHGSLRPWTSTSLGFFPQGPSPSHICLKITSLSTQTYSFFPEQKLPRKLAETGSVPPQSECILKIYVHTASVDPILLSRLTPESAHRGAPGEVKPAHHTRRNKIPPT